MPLVLVPVCGALLMYAWRGRGLCLAFVQALLALGVAVALVTELLSAASALSRGPVVAAWCGLIIAATALALRSRQQPSPPWRPARLSAVEAVLVVALLTLLVGELVVALSSMPNTYDSMTYHLARVGGWIQEESVEFRPVVNERKLWSAPMAEYAITHVQLLSGSVRSANLVQWTAAVAVAVTAYLLAGLLDLDRAGRLLAAMFASTVPMAVLQATSTQNDLLCAAFVLAAVHGFLSDMTNPGPAYKMQAFAATSLAFLTKGTSALFLLPVCLIWFVVSTRRSRAATAQAVLAGVILMTVVNAPFQLRIVEKYDRPLAPQAAADELVSSDHLSSLVVNTVRNTVTQAAVERDARQWTAAGRALLERLRLDPDDERTLAYGRFEVSGILDEDYAPSPLHLGLAAVAVAASLVLRRRVPAAVRVQLACALTSCLLFAAYLKWQPWINRLVLPGLLLWAAPVAYVLRRHVHRGLAASAVLLMFYSGVLALAHNRTRPVQLGEFSVFTRPPLETMFAKRPELLGPYLEAASLFEAAGVKEVGLVQGGDDWEYPLRVLTGGVSSSVRLHDAAASGWLHGDFHTVPQQVQAIFCTDHARCDGQKLPDWQMRDLGVVRVFLAPGVGVSPSAVGPPAGASASNG